MMTHLCKVLMLAGMVTAVASDESKTAVKVALGGEWFTSTNTGEANGYLMPDFKTKVLEPILK